jgi:D-proline reductase (dithiol) PrdB
MTSGDLEKGLLNRLLSRFPHLTARLKPPPSRRLDVPWTEPRVPLREAVVALVSTGGVHLITQAAFNCDDPEGDADYREVPVDTPREFLSITPDYYDHLDAEADLNLVLPIQRLLEFQKAGAVGRLHPVAYSLMGHLSGSRVEELKEKTSPEIASALASAGVHYALLIPAGGSCNRSVALLARVIESAGIATVALSSAHAITADSLPPRAMCLRFPFGHALGEPLNRNQHCAVLYEAFRILFKAREPATLIDSALKWRGERFLAPDWDEIKKLEPLPRVGPGLD